MPVKLRFYGDYGESVAPNVTNDFPISEKAFLILLLAFQLAYPAKRTFVKLDLWLC